jgi:hypothetical protein
MKEITSFIICFLAISSSFGQELKIKKEKIEDIDKTVDSISYKYSKAIDATRSLEVSLEIIDTTGRYILEDILDGESAGYIFYSRDGQKLNTYRPYSFFEQFYHDISQSYVVVVASVNQPSTKLKIAWLNHQGELLKEKEIDKKDPFLRDIKVINNRLVVVTHDLQHKFTITCYDQQLNTLWSKEVKEFIHYFGVKSVAPFNSIIVFTKQGIKTIGLRKGEDIWEVRTNKFQPSANFISINGELIFEKHYLGVISYEMDLDDNGKLKRTYNINFHIFDVRNGQIVFHDLIDGTEDQPFVFKTPLDLNSDCVYIKSKDKGWRYSLVR